ncbi:hypothetical protein CGLO_12863 [Colletotrichum gloeosporioides Cg-14]|uniref:Uncharacterized protein n=1 Tax=Colletotrichum gloeosporioides (strain Cg-14) TaxID=1237896 RepID=T0LIL3_COLGC|nr:hypothetical protein CGLO_12863 [Colletotrichum gloeosporioides Cg-14]
MFSNHRKRRNCSRSYYEVLLLLEGCDDAFSIWRGIRHFNGTNSFFL